MDKWLLEDGSGYWQLEANTDRWLLDYYVELNTPADAATVSDTTPTLEFTGTDPEGHDVRYNVQVDTVATFRSSLGSESLADSYSESNWSASYTNTARTYGQSFVGNGSLLSSVKFYISSTSTGGTLQAELYAHTGTYGAGGTGTGSSLATSATINANTISSSLTLVTFTFSGANNVELVNGTNYVIGLRKTGVDLSTIAQGYDNTSPTHAGNSSREDAGVWAALTADDLIFYLYTKPGIPLLDKTSGTDPGFLLTDTTKTNRLLDYFNQTTLNTALWTQTTGGSATMSYDSTGATVNFPASSTSSTIGQLQSASYNLTGGFAELQVLAVPLSSTTANGELRLQIDINNYIRWVYEQGTLYAQRRVSGTVTTVTSFAYNSTTHKYWRIRESGGTTFWETSENGDTWTIRGSLANPIAVTSLSVFIVGSAYQAVSNAGTFKFNRFNVSTFPSGAQVGYTVQSALTDGTYYWRVRGIDPGGSNTWSGWSTTRSFTLTTSTATLLTVQDLSSGSTLDSVALTQQNTLAVSELTSATTADAVSLTQQNVLAVNDARSASTVDNLTLTTNTPLTVQELTSPSTVDTISIAQAHNLIVSELTSTSTLDSVTLTQAHNLSVNELSSAATLDNVSLSQANTLAVSEITSPTTIESPSITTNTTLTVQELSTPTTADNVSLVQTNLLVLQELLSATTVDSLSLTQANQLAVNELSSVTTLESIALSQATTLILQEMTSTSTVDSPNLTQQNLLSLSDLSSPTILESFALTQSNLLAVQELSSPTTIENVALISGNALTVADLTSAITLESLSLSQANTLSISDLSSVTTLDSLGLTYDAVLAVHDLASVTTLESVLLSSGNILSVTDLSSVIMLDAVSLSQHTNLSVADLVSLTRLESVSLAMATTRIISLYGMKPPFLIITGYRPLISLSGAKTSEQTVTGTKTPVRIL